MRGEHGTWLNNNGAISQRLDGFAADLADTVGSRS
jgi:hypothetical protein